MRGRITALIDGLQKRARHEDDYLWFPEVATAIAPCSHMAAYQVLPVVRFYELTNDASALRYAEQLSRWAFYHDPTVTGQGVITKPIAAKNGSQLYDFLFLAMAYQGRRDKA